MSQSLQHIWHLYHLGKLELAARLADESVSRFPEWSEAYFLRSLIHAKADRIDQAVKDAEHGLALEPDDSWSYYVYAFIMLCKSDHSRAKVHLLHAINLNPESSEYFRLLAHTYIQTWELDSAYRPVLQALNLNPESLDALREYGLLKYHTEHFDDAAHIFRYGLSLDPQDDYCHQYLGWISLIKDDPDKAAAHFADSLRLAPLSVEAQKGLERARARNESLSRELNNDLNRWLNRSSDKPHNDFDHEDRVKEIIRIDLKHYLRPQELIQFEAGNPFVLEIRSTPESPTSTVSSLDTTISSQTEPVLHSATSTDNMTGTSITTANSELLSSQPIDPKQFAHVKISHFSNQGKSAKDGSSKVISRVLLFVIVVIFLLALLSGLLVMHQQ